MSQNHGSTKRKRRPRNKKRKDYTRGTMLVLRELKIKSLCQDFIKNFNGYSGFEHMLHMAEKYLEGETWVLTK